MLFMKPNLKAWRSSGPALYLIQELLVKGERRGKNMAFAKSEGLDLDLSSNSFTSVISGKM